MLASDADVLIVDLEDVTPPERRDEARRLLAALLPRWRAAGRIAATARIRCALLGERLLWRPLNEGGVRSSTRLRGEACAVPQRSVLPPGPLTHQASRELARELANPTTPSRKLRISVSTVVGKGGRPAPISSGKLLDDQ